MLDLNKPQSPTTEKPDLTDWIGRREITRGVISPSTAQTIHATLFGKNAAPASGEVIPHFWHWYAFPPAAAMEDLGTDGHPKLGGFLPPVPLERRMWAGGNLRFQTEMHVDEQLTRKSRIANVVEKTGASGTMVFVTVEHEIHGARGLCVSEQQDIVYLKIADVFAPPPAKPAPVEDGQIKIVLDRIIPISEPLLFRYSAITFNAHRIHYDQTYAQDVEKYPGLVVHGPLQASLLIKAASEWAGRLHRRVKACSGQVSTKASVRLRLI